MGFEERGEVDPVADHSRAAEKLTQSLLANPSGETDSKEAAPKEVDIHIRALTKRLQEHAATHVSINHSS